MQLTVRTYKSEVRDRVLAAIERIAKGCAMAAGIPKDSMPIVEVQKDQFTPAMYNNPELTKRLVAVFEKTLGDDNVETWPATMGGEDFSEFSLPDHSIPALIFISARSLPTKSRRAGKPELPLAELALEQIRARPGADDSNRHGRDDERRARIDEEVTR